MSFRKAARDLNISSAELQALFSCRGLPVQLAFDGNLGLEYPATRWVEFSAIFPDHARLTHYFEDDVEDGVRMFPEDWIDPVRIFRGAEYWPSVKAREDENSDLICVRLRGRFRRVVDATILEGVVKGEVARRERLRSLGDALAAGAKIVSAHKAGKTKRQGSELKVIKALLALAKFSEAHLARPFGAGSAIEAQLERLGFNGPKTETIADILKDVSELEPDRTKVSISAKSKSR